MSQQDHQHCYQIISFLTQTPQHNLFTALTWSVDRTRLLAGIIAVMTGFARNTFRHVKETSAAD